MTFYGGQEQKTMPLHARSEKHGDHDHEDHLHKEDWLTIFECVMVFLGVVIAAWITAWFRRRGQEDKRS